MKTRSLSVILLLALCITISGVYAAWQYAEVDMTAVHGHVGSFGLSNAVINNTKGTITVNAENAHFVIDQGVNYVTQLTANGTVTITFSPSPVYTQTHVGETSVVFTYWLVTDNADPLAFTAPHGTSAELFSKFDTTTKTDVTLTKQGNGDYVGTFSLSDVLDADLIAINDFTLDTYAKYQAFSGKIGTFGNIGIMTEEK